MPKTEARVTYVFLPRYIIRMKLMISLSWLKTTTFRDSSALLRFSKGNMLYYSWPNLIQLSKKNIMIEFSVAKMYAKRANCTIPTLVPVRNLLLKMFPAAELKTTITMYKYGRLSAGSSPWSTSTWKFVNLGKITISHRFEYDAKY